MSAPDTKLRKFLKDTKFPPEFDKKVNISNVNLEVLKGWMERRIREILGSEDDVVTETCFGYLQEGQAKRSLNFKELQYNVTGFLDKDAAKFCKDLMGLCVSAQSSKTGVPQELLEQKKAEIKREKEEAARDAEAARRKRDQEEAREREINSIRQRERGERGRGGYHGGRDQRDFRRYPPRDSRSPPDRQRPRHTYRSRSPYHGGRRSYSRSPPSRRPRSLAEGPPRNGPAERGRDNYLDQSRADREQPRFRRPSRSPTPRPPPPRRYRSPPHWSSRPRSRERRPSPRFKDRRRRSISAHSHGDDRQGERGRERRRLPSPLRNTRRSASQNSLSSSVVSSSRSPSASRESSGSLDGRTGKPGASKDRASRSYKRRRSSSGARGPKQKRHDNNHAAIRTRELEYDKPRSNKSSASDTSASVDNTDSRRREQMLKERLIATKKAKSTSTGEQPAKGGSEESAINDDNKEA